MVTDQTRPRRSGMGQSQVAISQNRPQHNLLLATGQDLNDLCPAIVVPWQKRPVRIDPKVAYTSPLLIHRHLLTAPTGTQRGIRPPGGDPGLPIRFRSSRPAFFHPFCYTNAPQLIGDRIFGCGHQRSSSITSSSVVRSPARTHPRFVVISRCSGVQRSVRPSSSSTSRIGRVPLVQLCDTVCTTKVSSALS